MAYYGYSSYGYGYGFDFTYLLVLIGALLSLLASSMVSSTFNKYAKIRSTAGMSGAQAARRILDRNGLYDVRIEHVSGNLTDHYDPRTKVLRLSDSTYSSPSVAAIGVAAHECGHAIQHSESYSPLVIRSKLAPLANFGSQFGLPIFMLGLVFGTGDLLMRIGIWVFLLAVAFQIVTLPVEFDASKRALAMLSDYGILRSEETQHSRKVLRAAAMTYVAAAAASVLNLLRLILLTRRRNDD
ncbi:MAG: zinc metallopeptidase [Lachnospiraceae bacterium]|nr:zinc metallopeptidase [Lachnospiraceae bacterium]